jgi:hypothetical protein
MTLLEVAKRIEKQLGNPMGDGGIDLDLLKSLRAAIREEEAPELGTDAAIQSLAVERSSGVLRATIETDAHVRAGEMLAALGAAAALEHNVSQLVQLLTAIRDIQAAKKDSGEKRES